MANNPVESFYNSGSGLPILGLAFAGETDTTYDDKKRMIKRTFTRSNHTYSEHWTYGENGMLKEYRAYGLRDTLIWHETYNDEGLITELYQHIDGYPIHWRYKYTTTKTKKQVVFRKEVYDANGKLQAAIESDITNRNEIPLNVITYFYNEAGHLSSETIRSNDSTIYSWYYFYDSDKHYKILVDAEGEEVKRVYLR